MFCSSKDFIPTLQKSKNAYCLTCAVCNKNYIAKTVRNIVTHLNELGSCVDQPMYEHCQLSEITGYWLLL